MDEGGDAAVAVSASALEAFLDSAADPTAGGAGRSDYSRWVGCTESDSEYKRSAGVCEYEQSNCVTDCALAEGAESSHRKGGLVRTALIRAQACLCALCCDWALQEEMEEPDVSATEPCETSHNPVRYHPRQLPQAGAQCISSDMIEY